MKKKLSVFIFSTLLFGCAPSLMMVQAENRSKLNNISLGISKSEVLNIMGTSTVKVASPVGWVYINSPYRSETMEESGKSYEILFFWTDTKKNASVVVDDDLTPIVLYNNKVVGYGWRYLKDNIRRYQIDIR